MLDKAKVGKTPAADMTSANGFVTDNDDEDDALVVVALGVTKAGNMYIPVVVNNGYGGGM